jgi:hypothetical protein
MRHRDYGKPSYTPRYLSERFREEGVQPSSINRFPYLTEAPVKVKDKEEKGRKD